MTWQSVTDTGKLLGALCPGAETAWPVNSGQVEWFSPTAPQLDRRGPFRQPSQPTLDGLVVSPAFLTAEASL